MPLLVALLGALLVLAGEGHAAETDNYYAWRHFPRDSAAAFNEVLNRRLRETLSQTNASLFVGSMSCEDVGDTLAFPLVSTGFYFFIGPLDAWIPHVVPRSNTEAFDRHRDLSLYRNSFRLGQLMPPDPTGNLGGVHVGVDKIGHFLVNGRRYWVRYRQARAQGAHEDEALRAAIRFGVEQENGILGLFSSGVFSYADLEANYQGLRFFRSLCEGDAPLLVESDDGWELSAEVDIRDYVNPCWDETWAPSSFSPSMADGVREVLEEQCPRLSLPRVSALRRRYAERGCHSLSHRWLEELQEAGDVPDARPFAIEQVCSASGSE